MKEGWQTQRLGDLFIFKNGRAFKKEEWTTSGVPIIRIQNLNNEDASFNYFLGEYSPDILVDPGDLLFSWSGTVGSSFGSHLWNGETGVLNQHIFKVGLRGTISKRYAFYGLRQITEAIEQSVNGAVGLVHITKEKLNEFTLPVPPLAEQQRIVRLLDEAFDGIATARANAEKNLQNAQALFESQLQSVFTERGPGWVETSLGKACEMYQPKTIGTKDLVLDGPYPVFGANGIIGRYDKYNHEEPQLLVTCRGATCGSVNISEPKSWITGNAMVIRPKDNALDLRFLEFVFRGGIDISPAITGAAQPQITRTNLSPLLIRFPKSVAEQARLAMKFSDLSDETQRLARLYEKKLAALESLKKSLLHQAFMGEL